MDIISSYKLSNENENLKIRILHLKPKKVVDVQVITTTPWCEGFGYKMDCVFRFVWDRKTKSFWHEKRDKFPWVVLFQDPKTSEFKFEYYIKEES